MVMITDPEVKEAHEKNHACLFCSTWKNHYKAFEGTCSLRKIVTNSYNVCRLCLVSAQKVKYYEQFDR